MSPKQKAGGIVYSTEHGRMCPQCSEPAAACRCSQNKTAVAPEKGLVRVGRETKGRKGKGVTVITGVPLKEEELKRFGKELKARCGAGGTVKGGIVEIQGDHREAALEECRKRGWKVKLMGG